MSKLQRIFCASLALAAPVAFAVIETAPRLHI